MVVLWIIRRDGSLKCAWRCDCLYIAGTAKVARADPAENNESDVHIQRFVLSLGLI